MFGINILSAIFGEQFFFVIMCKQKNTDQDQSEPYVDPQFQQQINNNQDHHLQQYGYENTQTDNQYGHQNNGAPEI